MKRTSSTSFIYFASLIACDVSTKVVLTCVVYFLCYSRFFAKLQIPRRETGAASVDAVPPSASPRPLAKSGVFPPPRGGSRSPVATVAQPPSGRLTDGPVALLDFRVAAFGRPHQHPSGSASSPHGPPIAALSVTVGYHVARQQTAAVCTSLVLVHGLSSSFIDSGRVHDTCMYLF